MMKYNRFEIDALLTEISPLPVSKLKVVNANWIRFPAGTTMLT
jgi:hypothetical protein